MKARKTITCGPLKIEHIPNSIANDADEKTRGHMWTAHFNMETASEDPENLTLHIVFDVNDKKGKVIEQAADELDSLCEELQDVVMRLRGGFGITYQSQKEGAAWAG